MSNDPDNLTRALRNIPAPDPRPEFIERALANATGQSSQEEHRDPVRLQRLFTRWETWVGAVLGGAVAAALTIWLLEPIAQTRAPEGDVTLALNEIRQIEVRIESERPLANATIRITLTGDIALDGFQNEKKIDWHANLDRGINVLSLPVIAQGKGGGRLIAVVEHEGKARTLAVDVVVQDRDHSRS